MDRVTFSSWAGNVVDNRGLDFGKFSAVDNLELPLGYDGYRVAAFMSWNGLVMADDGVNVVDMARSYLTEVKKLACGRCTIGYSGIRVMSDTLNRISGGQGKPEDTDLLGSLAAAISDSSKCDFCALAVKPVLDSLKYYQDVYTGLVTRKKAAPKSVYIIKITAPCMEACPAHQDIPGYIELIENRRYTEALEVIRQTNCFPGTTGRACVAFCEDNCVRNDIDSPLAIRALKRVPADHEAASGLTPVPGRAGESRQKVAVIGAGPAGLAASYSLALKGYQVTVFDEQPAAGGMLSTGIPQYRLPGDVLTRETNIVERLGIEIRPNIKIGSDIKLEQLSQQGFKAVFIATGAHLSRDAGIDNWNERYEGLVQGIKFLREANRGKKIEPRDRVLIVGGGNTAIDCARTCLRLGFKEVTIVYRRSRTEMPARDEEVEAAEKEGVNIHFLAVPTRIITENSRVTAAECIKMELGEPDASGRRRPVPVKGSEFILETDMVLPAIGELPDVSFTKNRVELTDWGGIKVAPSQQTSQPTVFAGGDCVTGPATIIEAVAAGNRAAASIDQYLKQGSITPDQMASLLHQVALDRQRDGGIVAKSQRQSPEELPPAERVLNFNEVEKCLTAEAATEEAGRCLRCYRVMLLAVNEGE